MRRHLLAIVAAAGIAGSAAADTVYFKDGSALDGIVKRERASEVTLELPGGVMTFSMADVDRIEENDKGRRAKQAPSEDAPGDAGPALSLPPLSPEDTSTLRDMLMALLTVNPAERDAARQRIERFATTRDLFPFLERALPYMPDRQAAEVLQLMYTADGARAEPVLWKSAHSRLPKIRAKALELLGALRAGDEPVDPERLRLFARGVLDTAPEVQFAAVRALHDAGDRRATPVLIKGLESADLRVQAASLRALRHLWATPEAFAGITTAEQWRIFLSMADEDLPQAPEFEQLEPLVEPARASDDDYNLALE
jgi:hypothetical protein